MKYNRRQDDGGQKQDFISDFYCVENTRYLNKDLAQSTMRFSPLRCINLNL